MNQNDLTNKLKFYRISEDEYALMKQLLGREPNPVEWPLFSALWSEHCSYKSSKVHLRKFSYRNSSTPDMGGENAGVVDLGYDEKIAFKMESHNHPSFIEPVQGAATGVGGILRDIFTMGARPIMSANFLCFGEATAPRMKYLMNGVVKGISSYGNCVGVPTVTGQTNFHPKYNKNILVNALNVGYFGPDQKMALSKAKGPGNWVVYVGAKTGRDGVHGASMASASFDDDSESKKPNVQIGDPFYEKLLIEACLEVLAKDYVVAMQDMGAAGLTSSSFEMASKGQVGLRIDLRKVPLRDQTMTPEDILLSESQERMLLICEPKNYEPLSQVFAKWGLDVAVLGEVQKDRRVTLTWGNEILTDIDPDLIVERAPQYNRPFSAWKYPRRVGQLSNRPVSASHFIDSLLKSMRLNSQNWVYERYDQRVGARTARGCESSVAFARLDHSARGLAVAVGCRPDLMEMDAKVGALDAVFYPALQMALKGAKVQALTDCLNFGNPQKPEIMSEFVASVDAIADAAKRLDAPVISGNVSFYNETLGENIVSTPAVGAVGLRDSVEDIVPDRFVQSFENIFLVKHNWVSAETLQSEDLSAKKFTMRDDCDPVEFINQTLALDGLVRKKRIRISASRTVGLGGVGVSCLKMVTDKIGFDLSGDFTVKSDSELFSEVLYAYILSSPDSADDVKSVLRSVYTVPGVEIIKIGETKPEKIVLSPTCELNFQDFLTNYTRELEVTGL